MRKPSFVNSFKTALVVVPLLASCGGSVNTSPMVVVDPNGLMLPDCQEGQLVGVDANQNLTCVSAVSGMLTPPNCLPGTQALTSTKDAMGNNVLSCVNKGSGMNDVTTSTRISTAVTKVTNLQSTVTMITVGGGTRAKYIGPSTNTTDGILAAAGSIHGARAADLICSTDYNIPGVNAHMCTPFEIYESLVIGDKLNQQSAVVGPLMVYMESWRLPYGTGTSEPTAGLIENCGAGTYDTGDHIWQNTVFTFAAPTGSSVKVAKFDETKSCHTQYQIACCK